MFDTHCHLLDDKFKEDIDKVLARIKDANASSLICATNLKDSNRLIDFLETHNDFDLYGSIGLDPQEVGHEGAEDFDVEKYREILNTKNKKIVAIGEIGLDYYWKENLEHKELQKDVFEQQVKLAKEFNLPVIIHCRDKDDDEHGAFADLFEILERVKSPATGVVHSFTGNLQQAEELIEMGYYLGFNGIITFKNAGHLPGLVKGLPIDKILIETDAPYLAPVPVRGHRNEPIYVKYVAQKIADILEIPNEKLVKKMDENAGRLFLK